MKIKMKIQITFKTFLVAICIIIIIICFVSRVTCQDGATSSTSPTVETKLGRLKGILKKSPMGKTVKVFYKIPFAEPPLGRLRFKPPLPPKSWANKTLDCSRLGPACVQKRNAFIQMHPVLNFYLGLGDEKPSEDCLYLNLFVPKVIKEKVPVMVWVYGGSFVTGTANSAIYDATTLASEEDVIVVTFNYRLSTFGFLYLGIEEAPGNVGLMDQAMALRFIKEHIGSFGGDSNRVTFFGESAGAISVAHHLHIASSQNLFQRAIIQSGSAHMPNAFETREALLKSASILADNIGCPFNQSNRLQTLNCLMNRSSDDIRDNEPTYSYNYNLFFKPVVDGKYIVKHPLQSLLEHDKLPKVDVIVGNVQDEATLFLLGLYPFVFPLRDNIKPKEIDLREMFHEAFGLKPNSIIVDTIMALYTNVHERDKYKRNVDIAIRAGTDGAFFCSAQQFENAMVDAGNSVFKYRFKHISTDFPAPKWIGSFHGSEIIFVFGEPLSQRRNFSEAVQNLSRTVMRYWANFARTGDPNLSPNDDIPVPFWPKLNPMDPSFVNLDVNVTSMGFHDRKRCHFWNEIFPKMYELEMHQPPEYEPLYLKISDGGRYT